jgi:hypothetical protein
MERGLMLWEHLDPQLSSPGRAPLCPSVEVMSALTQDRLQHRCIQQTLVVLLGSQEDGLEESVEQQLWGEPACSAIGSELISKLLWSGWRCDPYAREELAPAVGGVHPLNDLLGACRGAQPCSDALRLVESCAERSGVRHDEGDKRTGFSLSTKVPERSTQREQAWLQPLLHAVAHQQRVGIQRQPQLEGTQRWGELHLVI